CSVCSGIRSLILLVEVFQAHPNRKGLWGRPRLRWGLLWEHVSISVSDPEGALLPLPEEAGSADLLGCSCRGERNRGESLTRSKLLPKKHRHFSGGANLPQKTCTF
uniref:Uncharacterized protein n=1 Tax=Poecilia latipinna TaxID=48699 RepID=A0A3B3TZD8_9TELE